MSKRIRKLRAMNREHERQAGLLNSNSFQPTQNDTGTNTNNSATTAEEEKPYANSFSPEEEDMDDLAAHFVETHMEEVEQEIEHESEAESSQEAESPTAAAAILAETPTKENNLVASN